MGVAAEVVLDEAIARLVPDRPSGRRSETLLKAPTLRVVLVTMRAGAELHEHTAPGLVTIQALSGAFVVLVGGEARTLPSGAWIALEAGARHAVRAAADGAFLLTIAWREDLGEWPADPQAG
jgi:quercetin dioxygenase-like cupin family protein